MQKVNTKLPLFDYLKIILGCFVAAIGLTMFLIPNKVAAGGVSGLATVIHYLSGFSVGWLMLLLNIPLFILGVIFIGKEFGMKTFVGTALFSLFTEATKAFPIPTNDLLLSSVYGGIILGLGLGIVFKSGASTGGTDLAALLINRFFPSISIGKGILLVDFFVIISEGIIFNWELAMYSWIALFISSKVVDFVQEGFNYAKAVYIISNKADDISTQILDEMQRGVTLIEGKGAYTGERKKILLCVTTRIEIPSLKNIVHSIDPKAFVIVHNVHEVLGEGFSFDNE